EHAGLAAAWSGAAGNARRRRVADAPRRRAPPLRRSAAAGSDRGGDGGSGGGVGRGVRSCGGRRTAVAVRSPTSSPEPGLIPLGPACCLGRMPAIAADLFALVTASPT